MHEKFGAVGTGAVDRLRSQFQQNSDTTFTQINSSPVHGKAGQIINDIHHGFSGDLGMGTVAINGSGGTQHSFKLQCAKVIRKNEGLMNHHPEMRKSFESIQVFPFLKNEINGQLLVNGNPRTTNGDHTSSSQPTRRPVAKDYPVHYMSRSQSCRERGFQSANATLNGPRTRCRSRRDESPGPSIGIEETSDSTEINGSQYNRVPVNSRMTSSQRFLLLQKNSQLNRSFKLPHFLTGSNDASVDKCRRNTAQHPFIKKTYTPMETTETLHGRNSVGICAKGKLTSSSSSPNITNVYGRFVVGMKGISRDKGREGEDNSVTDYNLHKRENKTDFFRSLSTSPNPPFRSAYRQSEGTLRLTNSEAPIQAVPLKNTAQLYTIITPTTMVTGCDKEPPRLNKLESSEIVKTVIKKDHQHHLNRELVVDDNNNNTGKADDGTTSSQKSIVTKEEQITAQSRKVAPKSLVGHSTTTSSHYRDPLPATTKPVISTKIPENNAVVSSANSPTTKVLVSSITVNLNDSKTPPPLLPTLGNRADQKYLPESHASQHAKEAAPTGGCNTNSYKQLPSRNVFEKMAIFEDITRGATSKEISNHHLHHHHHHNQHNHHKAYSLRSNVAIDIPAVDIFNQAISHDRFKNIPGDNTMVVVTTSTAAQTAATDPSHISIDADTITMTNNFDFPTRTANFVTADSKVITTLLPKTVFPPKIQSVGQNRKKLFYENLSAHTKFSQTSTPETDTVDGKDSLREEQKSSKDRTNNSSTLSSSKSHTPKNNESNGQNNHHVLKQTSVSHIELKRASSLKFQINQGPLLHYVKHRSIGHATHVPPFHFPLGNPKESEFERKFKSNKISEIKVIFQSIPDGNEKTLSSETDEHFIKLIKLCDWPLYWKKPIYLTARDKDAKVVTLESFLKFYHKMVDNYHDEYTKFYHIVARSLPGAKGIKPEDLQPLIQDIIDTHPGLAFLKDAQEFHQRYIQTVIARIYFTVNRSWSGFITLPELRRSNLVKDIKNLEKESDINKFSDFFSYEHFYVIYCKFWELDTDHDLIIDKKDLSKHGDYALSSRIIDRIFSGAVTKGKWKENRMTYSEFVWFLIAEEDKTKPTSIEYWFRCMDLDGDGILSPYELSYFYEEQAKRLESLDMEPLNFVDTLRQVLDIIQPVAPSHVTLRDLKKSKMAPVFFDTFINVDKYLNFEQKDPFLLMKKSTEDQTISEWDKYVAYEYENLISEDVEDSPEEEK